MASIDKVNLVTRKVPRWKIFVSIMKITKSKAERDNKKDSFLIFLFFVSIVIITIHIKVDSIAVRDKVKIITSKRRRDNIPSKILKKRFLYLVKKKGKENVKANEIQDAKRFLPPPKPTLIEAIWAMVDIVAWPVNNRRAPFFIKTKIYNTEIIKAERYKAISGFS